MPLPTYSIEKSILPAPQETKKRRIWNFFRGVFVVLMVVFLAGQYGPRAVGYFKISAFTRYQCKHTHTAKLPSHYTLPSGDKIPSVALGVWKAQKGQVGAAVKVCRCWVLGHYLTEG